MICKLVEKVLSIMTYYFKKSRCKPDYIVYGSFHVNCPSQSTHHLRSFSNL